MREYAIHAQARELSMSWELFFHEPSDQMAIEYSKRLLAVTPWAERFVLTGPHYTVAVLERSIEVIVTQKDVRS